MKCSQERSLLHFNHEEFMKMVMGILKYILRVLIVLYNLSYRIEQSFDELC